MAASVAASDGDTSEADSVSSDEDSASDLTDTEFQLMKQSTVDFDVALWKRPSMPKSRVFATVLGTIMF